MGLVIIEARTCSRCRVFCMDVVATSDDGAPSRFPGVDRARLISTRRRTIIIRIDNYQEPTTCTSPRGPAKRERREVPEFLITVACCPLSFSYHFPSLKASTSFLSHPIPTDFFIISGFLLCLTLSRPSTSNYSLLSLYFHQQ
jgi:hypothetical protein